MTTVADFTITRGETIPFILTYSRPISRLAAINRSDGALAENQKPFGLNGRAAFRPLAAGRDAVRPLADHAKGADLCADRRHRGGAHHLPARADRRGAQLGLSLLLAARRHPHACFAPMNAGYYEEARAWRDWLLRAVAGAPSSCKSCTASAASADSPSGGCLAAGI